MRAHDDGGQVTPLVALLVVLVAATLVVLGLVGRRLEEQASARTAADAVALAGAAEGRPVADRVALANRAVIVEWQPDAHGVRVVVRVGRATASARAVRDCSRSVPDHLVHSAACPPSSRG